MLGTWKPCSTSWLLLFNTPPPASHYWCKHKLHLLFIYLFICLFYIDLLNTHCVTHCARGWTCSWLAAPIHLLFPFLSLKILGKRSTSSTFTSLGFLRLCSSCQVHVIFLYSFTFFQIRVRLLIIAPWPLGQIWNQTNIDGKVSISHFLLLLLRFKTFKPKTLCVAYISFISENLS